MEKSARSPARRAAQALLLLSCLAAAMAARGWPAEQGATQRTWYENGQLESQREYSGGRETGTHRGWWPDGKIRFVYHYRNGELDGLSQEYMPSGELYREQRYEKGHEAGLQRMYWKDGRVRASYVARDGRRFGLMGSKGCVTKDSTGIGAL